jgi:hypothetical protein
MLPFNNNASMFLKETSQIDQLTFEEKTKQLPSKKIRVKEIIK